MGCVASTNVKPIYKRSSKSRQKLQGNTIVKPPIMQSPKKTASSSVDTCVGEFPKLVVSPPLPPPLSPPLSFPLPLSPPSLLPPLKQSLVAGGAAAPPLVAAAGPTNVTLSTKTQAQLSSPTILVPTDLTINLSRINQVQVHDRSTNGFGTQKSPALFLTLVEQPPGSSSRLREPAVTSAAAPPSAQMQLPPLHPILSNTGVVKEVEDETPPTTVSNKEIQRQIITVPLEFQENALPTVKWQSYQRTRQHYRVMSRSKSQGGDGPGPIVAAAAIGSSSIVIHAPEPVPLLAAPVATPVQSNALSCATGSTMQNTISNNITPVQKQRRKSKTKTKTHSPKERQQLSNTPSTSSTGVMVTNATGDAEIVAGAIITPTLLKRLSVTNSKLGVQTDKLKEEYEKMFDHYTDGICIINKEGSIQYSNRALDHIFVDNDLFGKHISYLIPQNYINFDKCMTSTSMTSMTNTSMTNESDDDTKYASQYARTGGGGGGGTASGLGEKFLKQQIGRLHEYQTTTFQGDLIYVSISFGPIIAGGNYAATCDHSFPAGGAKFDDSLAPTPPAFHSQKFGFIIGFRDITEHRQLEQKYHLEYKKNEQLIQNLLPLKIIERIHKGEQHIYDEHDNATIGFCDIVQFTKFCSEHKSSEVVHLLNTLFTHFDKLTKIHGVTKIETIGDAYMIACGVFGEVKHSEKCLAFMIDALKFAKDYVGTEMRAGLSAGAVSSGVIGLQKPHFSLFGENVCKAARLESAGQPLCVHVSPEVMLNLNLHSFGAGASSIPTIDDFTSLTIKHKLTFRSNGIQLLKGLVPFESTLISF